MVGLYLFTVPFNLLYMSHHAELFGNALQVFRYCTQSQYLQTILYNYVQLSIRI